jgi:hypothetical protein
VKICVEYVMCKGAGIEIKAIDRHMGENGGNSYYEYVYISERNQWELRKIKQIQSQDECIIALKQIKKYLQEK